MRSVLLLAVGFTLLAAQATLGTLLPMHTFAPNLVLPIALALGVWPEVHVVRGAAVCFGLGYLLDSFCGNSLGLQTFVMVAAFMIARGAAVRLLPHGPMFVALFAFVMSVISSIAILSLQAMFGKKSEILTYDVAGTLRVVLQSALTTALFAPPIFGLVRRLESRALQKTEERASLSS